MAGVHATLKRIAPPVQPAAVYPTRDLRIAFQQGVIRSGDVFCATVRKTTWTAVIDVNGAMVVNGKPSPNPQSSPH